MISFFFAIFEFYSKILSFGNSQNYLVFHSLFRIFARKIKRMKKSFFKKRWVRLTGWTMAIIIAIVALLSTVANSSYVEDKLIGLATEALSKELNADIKIKHISLNLLAQHASIQGVTLKDMDQRDMVKIKEIWVNLRLRPLLHGELALRSVKIDDIDLFIVKPEDGPANYQFLIDNPKKKS